jgi:hypothetical protein
MEKLKRRNCFEDIGINGKVILSRILKELGMKVWIRLIWPRTGSVEGNVTT